MTAQATGIIDRLPDLRRAAKLPEVPGPDAAGHSKRHAGLGAAGASAACRQLYVEDCAAVNLCTEIAQKVEAMEAAVKDLREAVLPMKIQSLSSHFDSEEQACVPLIRKGRAVMATLRRTPVSSILEDKSTVPVEGDCASVRRMRENFATVRDAEFKRLVKHYFTVRGQHREEAQARTRRQLLFAYPDAQEEDLAEALLCPSLAASAISRRLERGPESVTLHAVLQELESKQGNLRLLEEGTKGLKLLFMQFDELVNQQENVLTEIETNIQTTLQQTEGAVDILKEAAGHKRVVDRAQCCCWVSACVVLLLISWWLMPKTSSEAASLAQLGAAGTVVVSRAFHGVAPYAEEQGSPTLPRLSAVAETVPASSPSSSSPLSSSAQQTPPLSHLDGSAVAQTASSASSMAQTSPTSEGSSVSQNSRSSGVSSVSSAAVSSSSTGAGRGAGPSGPRQRQQQLQQLLLQQQREEEASREGSTSRGPQGGASEAQQQETKEQALGRANTTQLQQRQHQKEEDKADDTQPQRRSVSFTARGAALRHVPLRSELKPSSP